MVVKDQKQHQKKQSSLLEKYGKHALKDPTVLRSKIGGSADKQDKTNTMDPIVDTTTCHVTIPL